MHIRLAVALVSLGFTLQAQTPQQIAAVNFAKLVEAGCPNVLPAEPLYSGAIPNSRPTPDAEVHKETRFGVSYTLVSRPTYTAYLPSKSRANGAAIIIFPGGGYHGLSFDMEGTIPAEYFNEHGIAAIVVKYRLPNPQTMIDTATGPLQDAQRAIQVVRQRAAEWGIDPHKIGVMGFSAGGHLIGAAITQFKHPVIDNPDGANLRPDFAVFVYPLVTLETGAGLIPGGARDTLLGPNPSPELVKRFSVEEQVTADTPPSLILAASDDQSAPVENSVMLYQALHQHGVSASLHLFAHGGHGFFFLPREEWQGTIWSWLKATGITP